MSFFGKNPHILYTKRFSSKKYEQRKHFHACVGDSVCIIISQTHSRCCCQPWKVGQWLRRPRLKPVNTFFGGKLALRGRSPCWGSCENLFSLIVVLISNRRRRSVETESENERLGEKRTTLSGEEKSFLGIWLKAYQKNEGEERNSMVLLSYLCNGHSWRNIFLKMEGDFFLI